MMTRRPRRLLSILSMILALSMLASCGAPGAGSDDGEYTVDLTGETSPEEDFSEHNMYLLDPGQGTLASDQTDGDPSAPEQSSGTPYAEGQEVINPLESGDGLENGTINIETPTDDYMAPEAEIPEAIEGEIIEPSKVASAVSKSSKKQTLLKNKSKYYYYYTQLNKEEKKIYKGLKSVLQYPDSTERGTPFLLKTVPASDKFNKLFQNAHLALMYDHPEFYFSYQRTSFAGILYYHDSFPDKDGFYEYQFVLKEPYANYKKEAKALNNAVKKILDSLDLNQSDVNIALQIHDRLIATCSYNDEANRPVPTYARTVYSALVTHDPICCGYSFGFLYLMQQAGLKATVVCGDAGSTKTDASGHMWNAVKIGAQWYEVDVTWDDIEPDSFWYGCQAGSALARDAAAMKKVTRRMFMVPTSYINDFKYSGNYKYTLKNGAWFMPFGNSVHIRTSASASPSIESKAPKAYGTYYLLGTHCEANDAIDTLVDDGQVFAESNERKLTNDDLKLLRRNKYHSAETMTKMAINELYARRKFIFTSKGNNDFYKKYHWYKGKTKDKKAVQAEFNKYETSNLKLLKKFLEKLS